ncbi:hypothetical protein BZM27_04530 [Paraburkholderia steynii]|uniref:DUF3717 domain-containing protein n=1 Tax=Paraburkholderia steynii TaxID=1245441 RepID=A0A4R0XN11_9BURK|nr:hypothetical protein BZM27_04530 [Paraburkholderia steynii]
MSDRLIFSARAWVARACETSMNKTAFTIVEIEQAINFCCARWATSEDGALCAKARPLADVYGLMIFRRANSIEASKLNDDLLDAFRGRCTSGTYSRKARRPSRATSASRDVGNRVAL